MGRGRGEGAMAVVGPLCAAGQGLGGGGPVWGEGWCQVEEEQGHGSGPDRWAVP
jgi:hypothetical protein